MGFQARGTSIPTVGRTSQPFPFIRTAPKLVEHKALDYQYTSVDDDEDGFPDSAPIIKNTGGDVHVVSPAKDSHNSGTAIVRVTNQSSAAVSDVRVLTPTKTSYETTAGDIRLLSPSKSSHGLTDTEVRLVENNQSTEDTYGNIPDIRVVTPTQVSNAPVIVRVTNVAEADTPIIIKQKTDPITTNQKKLPGQVNTVRSPLANYEKYAFKTTGQLDEFLKSLETNTKNVGNSYNINGSIGTLTSNQDQFQQDFQIQDTQTIQGDSVSVDSIGFFITA